MDRWRLDLGEARDNKAYNIHSWAFMYIGDCDGDVTVRLGSPSSSALNPEEFDKLTDVKHLYYMHVTNTAQAGKILVLYFDEKRRGWLW